MRLHRQRAASLALAAALFSAPASALPVISEVFYDAEGSDDGLSFVELYGVAGASLEGMTLEGINGSNGAVSPVVVLSGSIPGDGFFVVADGLGDGTTGVAGFDLIANFDFQNGPDSIALFAGGAALDAVGYGAFGPGEVFAGEGEPAPDAPAGSSLARHFANLDSDDNAADFAVLATPTPGVAPLAIPEPAAGSATLLGLVLLAARARRRC